MSGADFQTGHFFSFLLGLMICGDDDGIGGHLGGLGGYNNYREDEESDEK